MAFRAESRRKLPIHIDEEEYTLLLEATQQPHHKIAFMLAWESGLRISEIISLKPEDININNKQINIIDGKGGRDRIVPLPRNWMHGERHGFLWKKYRPYHIKYIPISCGIRSLQAAFTMYAKISGLTAKKPTVHFHSLRHGFATHCYESGMGIEQIQILLGHSDIQTTMIYTHVSPFKALNAYRAMT